MTDRLHTSPYATYLLYLAEGVLAYQADTEGRAVFYPRVVAPLDRQGELEWQTSAGLGTVYATTYVEPRGEAPYNVALIDMDEGFRLMSRVEGVPADQVRIGLRVHVRIHATEGNADPYPVFDPAEEA